MSAAVFSLLNLGLILGAAFIGMRSYRRAHPDGSGVEGVRLLSARVRAWYSETLDPFEEWLVRRGVHPAALSYAQLAGGVICGLAYGAGLVFTGGVLLLFTGTLDILDGKVARRGRGASRRGAFLDSVVDRYAEFSCWVGLLAFFGSGWPAWMVLLAILGGMMVSYARARAEALGVSCQVGWLQRPERFVILGFGSIFSTVAAHVLGGGQVLLVVTVTLLALFSNVTAGQRIVYASRMLEGSARG